jgi:hypothetical protein
MMSVVVIYHLLCTKDRNEPWIAVDLGQVVPSTTYSPESIVGCGRQTDVRHHQLQSLWMLPSLI